MIDIKEIADNANLIVNGYAFTAIGDNYRVLNLNIPERAALLDKSGEILETSMDDIELVIVRDYFKKNFKFLRADLNYA